MKLFIPMPGEDWVCDVIIDELHRATTHQVVSSFNDADVVWHYAKWVANRHPNIPCMQPGHRPTITTVHHIVPSKGLDIVALDAFTDIYHVPNRITEQQLSKMTKKPIQRLPYWTPTDAGLTVTGFRQDDEAQQVEQLLRERFVFASMQRDTEGASIGSIPQPKLEKGPDLFCDAVSRFSVDEAAVFIGGWRRQFVQQRLSGYPDPGWYPQGDGRTFQTHTDVMKAFATFQRHGAYYLITSRFEGGPQAVFEAAAARVRVLSTHVGIAPEVLHPKCIVCAPDDPRLPEKFERAIRQDRQTRWMDETLDYNEKRAYDFAISNVAPAYDELIRKTFETFGS